MEYKKPIVVAEIGCNHMGNLDIAFELIKISKDSGADYAKFQKRNNKELLSESQYNAPHPNPINSYGETYGEHREKLEFDIDTHKKIKDFCEKNKIGYATSVWDITSATEISSLNPDYIKIPSALNNNLKLLEYLIDNYKGFIHISFGMTYKDEMLKIFSLFESKKCLSRLVVYSCTSGYPVPAKDVCLLEIKSLKEIFGQKINEYGFSGHHKGVAIDISAYTLGAVWIERHFTKDRTWKGTDHAASLEPQGLNKLVRDLNNTHIALTYKESEILEIEQMQRDKLKFNG
jgi:N-acetylneuraminate synthase